MTDPQPASTVRLLQPSAAALRAKPKSDGFRVLALRQPRVWAGYSGGSGVVPAGLIVALLAIGAILAVLGLVITGLIWPFVGLIPVRGDRDIRMAASSA